MGRRVDSRPGPLFPGNPNRLQVEYMGNWYLIDETIDMAHVTPNDAGDR